MQINRREIPIRRGRGASPVAYAQTLAITEHRTANGVSWF